ncbi:MAG: single-stranded-DNA-specific exonuclease RecJ [Candidatus Bipolaricaulota bacterium]
MKSLLSENRVWSENQFDEELVDRTRKKLNCSKVFAKVVSRRYGEKVENASLSLDSSQSSLRDTFHSPEDLQDLTRAVDRLVKAIEQGENVFIHGDFDVDGLSSSVLVYRGLKCLEGLPGPGKLKVDVGSRDYGHGINRKVSARLIDEGFDLLITTDCGIKGIDEIDHLQNFGVDVIVTDHHEPSDSLPPAVAVVDPKREDSSYPNPHLSGAGVAYKVMDNLLEKLGKGHETRKDLLQLAALGTISDLVPLITESSDENRRLVKVGIEYMNGNPITGISALLGKIGGEKGKVKPEIVSYRIAPKLNSANRVGDPQVSFMLLATEDRNRADHLAKTLIDYDRDRSRLQNRLIRTATEKLKDRDFDPEAEGLVFVVGEEWNPGIIGLIASRLSERFNLPAVVLSKERTKCRGSVRGVEGLSIVEGLSRCSNHLVKFGGHKMAGGFTASSSEIIPLKNCLKEWASSRLDNYEEVEKNVLEARLNPVQVDKNLYREVENLSPFGKGNPRPKFWMEGLNMVGARRVGNSKKHLKMKLADNDEVLDCIGFGMGESLPLLKERGKINPVFTLDLNDWGGSEKIQLKLEDFVS